MENQQLNQSVALIDKLISGSFKAGIIQDVRTAGSVCAAWSEIQQALSSKIDIEPEKPKEEAKSEKVEKIKS